MRHPRQLRCSIRRPDRSPRNGHSLSENARAFALINMAMSDSLVASFFNKYHYNFWRPETAIRAGDTDGNPKTDADPSFVPFIATPCFPSYPSNHGSASNGGGRGSETLYGEGGHSITLSNPAVPNIVLQYTSFKQITDDISDARVYGGIHFRTDQVAGRAWAEPSGPPYTRIIASGSRRRMTANDECRIPHSFQRRDEWGAPTKVNESSSREGGPNES